MVLWSRLLVTKSLAAEVYAPNENKINESIPLVNNTAGVREGGDANRTREAGDRDEIPAASLFCSQQSTLNFLKCTCILKYTGQSSLCLVL